MLDNVFISGGSGLLGLGFAAMDPQGKVTLNLHSRDIVFPSANLVRLDLFCSFSLEEALKRLDVKVFIHCAAITDVDYCQSHPEEAFKINCRLPRLLAEICSGLGIKFVFISSDQLFDGENVIYTEEDPCSPLNIYGETKAKAEESVLKVDVNSLVIRTNFFGWGTSYRKSFSDFVIEGLAAKKSLTLYDDIFYTPVIRERLVSVVSNLISQDCSGIFNVSSDDITSKYVFGQKIAKLFEFDNQYIVQGNSLNTEFIAPRPRSMALSSTKLCARLGSSVGSTDDFISDLKSQMMSGYKKQIGEI